MALGIEEGLGFITEPSEVLPFHLALELVIVDSGFHVGKWIPTVPVFMVPAVVEYL